MPFESYPQWVKSAVVELPAFISITQLSNFMQRSKRQISSDINAGLLKQLKSKAGEKRKKLVSRLHVAEYLHSLYELQEGVAK